MAFALFGRCQPKSLRTKSRNVLVIFMNIVKRIDLWSERLRTERSWVGSFVRFHRSLGLTEINNCPVSNAAAAMEQLLHVLGRQAGRAGRTIQIYELHVLVMIVDGRQTYTYTLICNTCMNCTQNPPPHHHQFHHRFCMTYILDGYKIQKKGHKDQHFASISKRGDYDCHCGSSSMEILLVLSDCWLTCCKQ